MLPADKLRSEGEWVQYSDRLHFENMKHRNSYITISSAHRKERSNSFTTSSRNIMRHSGGDGVVLHPSVRGRYEVNASPFISSMQIIPFQISDLSATHQGPVIT